MEHRGCFQILVTKTSKPRVSDSLAWFPTPLAPPEPTKEEILAIAAEDLKSATKILSRSKLDLNEWGRLLASKIRKLDDYIHTYHPWIQKQDDEETQLLFEQLWEPRSEGESSAYLKDGPPPYLGPPSDDQKSKNRQMLFSHYLPPMALDFHMKVNSPSPQSHQFHRWDTVWPFPKNPDRFRLISKSHPPVIR